MIQPIKNIFTNWRNPQHRQDPYVSEYLIGENGPLRLSVLSEDVVDVYYRTPPPTSHIVHATMGGIAPGIDTWNAGSVFVMKIYVPVESHTTYIAWEKGGVDHILRDER